MILNHCPLCGSEIGDSGRYVVDAGDYFHIGCYGIHPEIVDPRPSLIYVTTGGTRHILDRLTPPKDLAAVDDRMPRRDWEILGALWRTFTNGDDIRRWA